MSKSIKPGSKAYRAMQVTREAVDHESRTVSLAFSSETPYDRWWGTEILDHAPTSIRLGRLTSGAPLLIDHDNSIRSQIGVIESVEIGADRVGRATVRFGKSALADEVFAHVQDGIVRNVSVGYMIHEAKLIETNKDTGVDTYLVTDWEPLELSLTPVPADASVGVGRAADSGGTVEIIETIEPLTQKESIMAEITIEEARATAVADYRKTEQTRVDTIMAIGEQFKRFGADKIASEAIRNGESIDAVRSKVMDLLDKQPKPTADIGMSAAEVKKFSVVRALNALANPTDGRAREAAAFEFEASRAAAEKQGREIKGILVPNDVLKRELTVGTASAGGHTVGTDMRSGDFIDMLRNAMVLNKMGVRVLSDLVGNIAIPKQSGGATFYMLAESGSVTSSDQTFAQVTMSPKTGAAKTQISRRLLLQSSMDIEALVRNDLASAIGLGIENMAINGTGASNQPTGILATSGIGSVAGGTNGAAPTWANMIDLETSVAVANAAVGNLSYLSNAKVRGKLKQTFKNATYGELPVWEKDGSMNGYTAHMTNAVPSNLTKGTASGVCSAIAFGNWADLLIGLWGGLELQVDPYSSGDTGAVIVRAFQDFDVAVRNAVSFAAMKDALTA
jgi:HK97 family phage major capsid protein/HK97 family phage prohead protease